MNLNDNPMRQSNMSLNEEFWAELDSISESGADLSPTYAELDDESSPNKSLEGKSKLLQNYSQDQAFLWRPICCPKNARF